MSTTTTSRTLTATPISTERGALLAVERAGPVHSIAALRRGVRLAPRVLARGEVVRAALVPTQAGPLAGDRDAVRIVVGAGAALRIEPVAATLVLPGAERTRLDLDVTVAAGGRLVLDEGPLIVAAGATVRRRVTIALEPGAVIAMRETIVLGRHGEPPGHLDACTRVTLDGEPLLHDALRLGPRSATAEARVALPPGHRVVGALCLLGAVPPPGDQRALVLAGPGAVRRATGGSAAAVAAELAETWERWAGAALAPHGRPTPP